MRRVVELSIDPLLINVQNISFLYIFIIILHILIIIM